MITQLKFSAFLTASLIAGQANALMFDQNVTPDIIYGTGNSNGAFTVGIKNNVEVGLRIHDRFVGTNHSNGDGTYSPDASTPPNTLALWNYDFSVNLNQDGTSNNGRLFDDVSVLLSIDTDPGVGITFVSFDPLTVFVDNAFGTNVTANGAGADDPATNTDNGVSAGLYVMQNSQNIGFGGFLDPTIPATWDFALSVQDSTGVELASTRMTVLVAGGAVPEPAALALMALGVVGLGFRRHRRALV